MNCTNILNISTHIFDGVSVYTADVTPLYSAEFYALALSQVPEYRLQKTERFRFLKDRCLSLGAGLLLRKACADLGIPGADENIITGAYGKPHFAEHPEIHFNLSHSGTVAMCVFGFVPVGCDVEQLRDCDLSLAKRFFHSQEYESLLAAPEYSLSQHFFSIWTMKESYIKCTGLGLSQPLEDFSVLAGESNSSSFIFPEVGSVFSNHISVISSEIARTDSYGSTHNDKTGFSSSFSLHQWFTDGFSFAVCARKE